MHAGPPTAPTMWRGIAIAEFVLLFLMLAMQMHMSASSCPSCPAAAQAGGTNDCPPCVDSACPVCPKCEQSESQALVAAAAPEQMKLGCLLRDPTSGALLEAGGDFYRQVHAIGISDKVTDHQYQGIYAKYLDRTAAADIDVTMLEIGLGCDMTQGPGGSVEMWRKFFGNKNLKLHVLEYVQCLRKWDNNIAKMNLNDADRAWYEGMKQRIFWGSQDDQQLLARVRDELGTVDFVVDDGSHQMDHMIATFEAIFPIVKPGGVYFIEDLETSFYQAYGATPQRVRSLDTAVGYLMRAMRDLHYRPELRQSYFLEEDTRNTVPISAWIRSIDCDRGVCAIIKRAKAFVPARRQGPNWAWPCKWNCAEDASDKSRRCRCA